MKISKKEFNMWIEALRSGKYKQAKGMLQNARGYCCLGVACEILGSNLSRSEDNNFLIGGSPSTQRMCKAVIPDWLNTINGYFENLDCKNNEMNFKNIMELNDSLGLSFNEIADVLELVFIHGAYETNVEWVD